MRRTLLAATLAVAAFTVQPSWASREPAGPPTVSVVHTAPLPCLVACAYDFPSEAGFNECARPTPSGSFDISTFRMTDHAGTVYVNAVPVYGWDMFACTVMEPSSLITCMGCNSCCWECNGPGGTTTALGCVIDGDLTWEGIEAAAPGSDGRFRLISYNWLDTEPLPVNLWGPVEVIDDSYEASIL